MYYNIVVGTLHEYLMPLTSHAPSRAIFSKIVYMYCYNIQPIQTFKRPLVFDIILQ